MTRVASTGYYSNYRLPRHGIGKARDDGMHACMHTGARLLMTSGGGFCEALLRRRLRAWPSCHTRKMERENG